MSGNGRRTKIVCTIGPATSSEDMLRALIVAGMNVARLNFSHGTHDEHARVIERVRRLSASLRAPVGVLQDLAGPKVRIGTFASGSIDLVAGDPFTLTTREVTGDQRAVSVSYPGLPSEVKPGERLLLADGSVTLDVLDVTAKEIRCRVVVGGALSAHKGVNVPSGLFGLPILREQDVTDLRFGVAHGVDFIGLSFVRTAEDVLVTRKEIAMAGGDVPIVAKIETSAALQQFDEILAEADGIMIARGDLSIETPFARVPVVQKELIAKANRQAKPAITATQMLFSMVTSPYPTRAEVADVANAVFDGSDAVMLSDETTIGKFPVKAVETMAAIVSETERGTSSRRALGGPGRDEPEAGIAEDEALAHGACELATRIGADFIATLTESGRTARLVAKYRPLQPILAATYRPEAYRRLTLVHGVTPVEVPATSRTRDEMIATAHKVLSESGWRGRRAVFVTKDSIFVGNV